MLTSKRLLEITKFIDENDFVADIGADHGKLIIEIANKYKNNKYLAVENKIGPYTNLKNAVENYNYCKNIECSFSDGIEYLPSHINTLVLSGMGGYNVINIIQKSLKNIKNIKKIVFSVHRNTLELEFFLKSYGYFPENSTVVYEHGQYYNIVSAVFNEKLSLIHLDDEGNVIEEDKNNDWVEQILKNKEEMKKWNNFFEEKFQELSRNTTDTYVRTGHKNEN